MEELPNQNRGTWAGKWTFGSGKIERPGAWWLETTATVEEVDSSIFTITYHR
jgi:hypothetical protein